MRVLFIGGTKRGYLSLDALIRQGADLVGVINLQQDQHEVENYEQAIAEISNRHSIPHYVTKWMKDRDYAQLIAEELKPDLILIIGCRILISKEIYELPRFGSLAVHDSLLPNYRGFAPLNWAIINGEARTGVTLYYLSEQMDGGDIVEQKQVEISPDDTAPVVYTKVCQATVDLLQSAYPRLLQHQILRVPQDYAQGSFTCSRTPDDGLIDWQQSTIVIHNQVRALTYPYPGAFTFYQEQRLYVWRACPVTCPPAYVGRIPGRVIYISREEGFVDVLTGDGILRLWEVQLEMGERSSAAQVIHSIKATLGISISSLLGRIKQLEQRLASIQSPSSP